MYHVLKYNSDVFAPDWSKYEIFLEMTAQRDNFYKNEINLNSMSRWCIFRNAKLFRHRVNPTC